jgi:hypothetical protein
MIHAGEQGLWRSWMQAFSKNNKTSGGKCYKLGLNPDPSNAALEWQAGSLGLRSREPIAACPLEGLVRMSFGETSSFARSIAVNQMPVKPAFPIPIGMYSAFVLLCREQTVWQLERHSQRSFIGSKESIPPILLKDTVTPTGSLFPENQRGLCIHIGLMTDTPVLAIR